MTLLNELCVLKNHEHAVFVCKALVCGKKIMYNHLINLT